MTASELKSVLDKVIAKAEESKHDEFANGDWDDIDSSSWARIVRLMNLCTACKDVMRFLKDCNIEEF